MVLEEPSPPFTATTVTGYLTNFPVFGLSCKFPSNYTDLIDKCPTVMQK
jgi:hypothetical protein